MQSALKVGQDNTCCTKNAMQLLFTFSCYSPPDWPYFTLPFLYLALSSSILFYVTVFLIYFRFSQSANFNISIPTCCRFTLVRDRTCLFAFPGFWAFFLIDEHQVWRNGFFRYTKTLDPLIKLAFMRLETFLEWKFICDYSDLFTVKEKDCKNTASGNISFCTYNALKFCSFTILPHRASKALNARCCIFMCIYLLNIYIVHKICA